MKSSLISVIQKVWFLEKIIENSDFKQAASVIGVTPSALTQAIKSLESHFNQTLIFRNKGNVSLTPEGIELIERFTPLLKNVMELESSFEEDNKLKRIRIGAYDSLALKYLPKLHKELLKINSEIKLDLQVGRSSDLSTLVHKGLLDLALTIDGQQSDAYDSTILSHHHLSIFTHQNNLKNGKIDSSIGLGCLSSQTDGRQTFLTKTLKALNLKTQDFSVQTDSFESLLSLCLEGSITAILPVELVKNKHPELIDISKNYDVDNIMEISKHPITLISRKSFSSQLKNEIVEGLKKVSTEILP